MDYDREKLDEVVLALLYLNSCGDGRAWKNMDWNAMDRLHGKGLIDDPKSKAKSVILTEDGWSMAKAMFAKYFGLNTSGSSPTDAS